jgi:hypothetical protein
MSGGVKTPKTKLYELTSVCDEGFDGAVMLCWAHSKLEVAEYILQEIRFCIDMKNSSKSAAATTTRLRQAERYMSIIRSIDPKCLHTKDDYAELKRRGFQYDEFENSLTLKRLQSISAKELLNSINHSQVDGDSSFQVRIHEYDKDHIIDLTTRSSK